MKVYIKNQQRLIKVNQHRIRRDLKKTLRLLGLNRAELSVLFVNDRRMKILNRQYRGIDRTTDVLSFPQQENPPLPPFTKGGHGGITKLGYLKSNIVLGDIVINLHQTKRQAAEHGLTFNEELRQLMIHGLLHLIGYDHEKSRYHKSKMESKGRELLKALSQKSRMSQGKPFPSGPLPTVIQSP
ncbi:MAG: rRNA maturation RNase YbeY [Nitrospirota bacterium]